jgi:hypothetical protein
MTPQKKTLGHVSRVNDAGEETFVVVDRAFTLPKDDPRLEVWRSIIRNARARQTPLFTVFDASKKLID